MKRIVFAFAFVCSMLVLTACASQPTADQLSHADYGSPMSQDQAEAAAKAWLNENLKDPESARYEWSPVYRGWWRDNPFAGSHLHFGYLLEGQVNSKNGFGGYTGFLAFKFMFRDGTVVHVYSQQPGDDALMIERY